MSEFRRHLLPDPISYFEGESLTLAGRGKWRTTSCAFHGGSDSLRVNVTTGAWVCMSCGVKGGDVLSYAMRRHGLDFVSAARALGAYLEDGKPRQWRDRPRAFSAREALGVLTLELLVCVVVISDARRGIAPNDADWRRFLEAAGRVDYLAGEFKT